MDDARVFKTITSLRQLGARVTIGCTNPGGRPQGETVEKMRIVRFPHPNDFFLKRLYARNLAGLHPRFSRVATGLHEGASSSPVKKSVRSAMLFLNHRHVLANTAKVNRLMTQAFAGQRFNLVHCNDLDTLNVGCSLKSLGAARELLYDAHEFWPGLGTESANRSYGRIEGAAIHKADYVVTVNPLISELLEKTYDLPKAPAVLLNCPPVWDEYARRPLHSPARVLFQGRLQAYRGLEELITAFRMIDTAELILSGDGPLQAGLQAFVRSEGMESKVRFTGRYERGEEMTVVGGADIGVIPYRAANLNNTYASPNKLFDYMMGGLAIAASDLPYLATVVRGQQVGVTFPQVEPVTIAASIRDLIADEETLIRYQFNSRRLAIEEYHWNKQFTDQYPWKP